MVSLRSYAGRRNGAAPMVDPDEIRRIDRALAELVLQAIHLQERRKKIAKLQLSTDGADHFRSLQPERVAKVAALFQLPKK